MDAVLADRVPGILIGALATGRPTAALMANIYLRPTPGMPVHPVRGVARRQPAERARDAVIRPQSGDCPLRGCCPASTPRSRAQELASIGDLFDLLDWCRAVLVLTSPSFDFQSPHISREMCTRRTPAGRPGLGCERADWRPDGDDPRVLVATSSVFQDQTDLLRRVAAALGRLPVRGLITAGRAVDPADVPAPPNVTVVPYRAPTASCSPRRPSPSRTPATAACSRRSPPACHWSACPWAAIRRTTPVRVLRLGAGVRLDKNAPPERIAAAVRSVLESPATARRRDGSPRPSRSRRNTRPSAADRAEACSPADPAHPAQVSLGGSPPRLRSGP